MIEYIYKGRGKSKRALVNVYLSVCVCLSTFSNARSDRTLEPIFMRFGTRTNRLIHYDCQKYYGMYPLEDVTVGFFGA